MAKGTHGATVLHRVKSIMEAESLSVETSQEAALCDIASKNITHIDLLQQDGTPQQLLWEEQKKYLTLDDGRQMRWHPTILQ